ncbi:hypothetical protein [Nonomuraea phyllanthi]|nr:hypothetical protein [Nonomuraea phyllanthi]
MCASDHLDRLSLILHWDMTSISLHGDYHDAEPGFARPRFGHPKDRRPDLKHVQAGIAVSSVGAIPR